APKRLVMPRSSSFMVIDSTDGRRAICRRGGAHLSNCLQHRAPRRMPGAMEWGGWPKPTSPCEGSCLAGEVGLDLDLSADDLLLERLELGSEAGVDLALPVVEVGQAHATVLKRADVGLVRELALTG